MKQKEIVKELFKNQDLAYKDFTSNLTPTIKKETMIGVRLPVIKKMAKEIGYDEVFLRRLPHDYYEENHLHSFIINNIKDYDLVIKEINEFLPYIDNWAVCDSLKVNIFKKNKDKLIKDIKKWLKSKHPYSIRLGVSFLMAYYLGYDLKEDYLDLVGKIKSEEYYVNMMRAWYFATALAKNYDVTLKYLKNHKIDDWTLKKTISKVHDSYRVSDEHKKEIDKELKKK